MWPVTARRLCLAALAAIIVGAAAVTAVAGSAGASTPGNLVRARAEAAELLRLLRVPPGAVQDTRAPAFGGRGVLGAPGYDEATPNLVDAHFWWTVSGRATEVLAYATKRMPRGAKLLVSGWGGPRPSWYMKSFSLRPIPGVLAQRVLAVTVAQLDSTTTAIRTDGEAVWITPRPASERVPSGVREIDITSPHVAVKVVGSPATQIVSWINSMGIGQPGSINCPVLGGPTVTFVFRDGGGREVARASGVDFDGTSGECNAIALSIRGRAQPPLIGGDFYGRVQRLLGVRFARSKVSLGE